MLKKTITYIDYNGDKRTEDFWFNLNKAELMEMELSETGGMQKMLERIIEEKDAKRIVEVFKDIILKAYGEKTPDGKRFIKSKELSEAFSQTEAYSELFIELMDPDASAKFINGLLPVIPPPAINAENPAKIAAPTNN